MSEESKPPSRIVTAEGSMKSGSSLSGTASVQKQAEGSTLSTSQLDGIATRIRNAEGHFKSESSLAVHVLAETLAEAAKPEDRKTVYEIVTRWAADYAWPIMRDAGKASRPVIERVAVGVLSALVKSYLSDAAELCVAVVVQIRKALGRKTESSEAPEEQNTPLPE